ncbi:MAG: ANTAR domain-containing protein [Clostridiales bacterium]|nr:ANTAR domain-containing protein [Clostridiales bacterium]
MRRDNAYSVLLVSSNEKMTSSLSVFLSREDYGPVVTSESVSAARRLVSQRDFDIVIINTPLKDEIGINFAIEIADSSSSSVMLLVKADMFDEVSYKMQDCGVFTLAKPVNSTVLGYSMKMMCSTRERLLRMEQKQKTFEEKLEEIKIVNRAKIILVENLSMSEEEAHKFIEKNAMNERKSKVFIAKKIISEYKKP